MSRMIRSVAACFTLALWLTAVGFGFVLWNEYETTAGAEPAFVADVAPSATAQPELAMYAHPHCPCAKASVAEYAELARALDGRGIVLRIVFIRPAGVEAGWERSALWTAASAIPGVRVEADETGAEARHVGATTSGCAVYRDAARAVQFRGGLTSSRGRGGESLGRASILALAAGSEPGLRATPTFGCPLFETMDELTTREVRNAGND